MTRPVRNRILKDVNGDINDHLRNHVHLTNCIHLKNHMHKHCPILSDRLLIRDFIALQRSRSLRDPSASPRSWHSPSVVDLLAKTGGRDVVIQDRRRSVGIERQRPGRRLSGSSPPFAVFPAEKSGSKEVYGANDEAASVATCEQSDKSNWRDSRRVGQEDYVQRSARNSLLDGNEYSLDHDGNESLHNILSRKYVSQERNHVEKGRRVQGPRPEMFSEHLDDIRLDSDDLTASNAHPPGCVTRGEKSVREAAVRVGSSVLNKGRRCKFRRARRTRPAMDSKNVAIQNEMSVASNFMGKDSVHGVHRMEEAAEEQGSCNVKNAPANGGGIPWNWSRIHDRGKTFLDMAGRSLSCGMSERKGGAAPHRKKGTSDVPMASHNSSSSSNSDAEGLPLLIHSQDSAENAGEGHDYSGELGIFADNLLNQDLDSDLASEARSGNRSRGHQHRHRSLTQMYAPKTFQDLVGQNLVSQALSNTVFRRRIGFLYVFYGPPGTGKTSCARIFARALNCQASDHHKPCCYCSSCVSHDVGKSRTIREVGPVNNLDFEGIMDLLDRMIASRLPSSYKVIIFDDCEAFSAKNWSAILKAVDRAPRQVVFILLCSRLDVLPHSISSRCQKFFFPKLKDADIIFTLQRISSKEGFLIDVDALKLIAARSDGSLRDALMTLEQLSLLGQRISVMLVQELVGLVSDEKLVDLLDLALSADTVNTVRNLREIMGTGVEPLALMSQLATVITDILAGSFDLTKERHRRKFFRWQPLAKDDMEKLRHALKTLSEADKQLRMSNDKLTWLTAVLLQLAPDQQYLLLNSSANAETAVVINNAGNREVTLFSDSRVGVPDTRRGMLINDVSRNVDSRSTAFIQNNVENRATGEDAKDQTRYGGGPHHASSHSDGGRARGRPGQGRTYKDIQDVWLEVLEQVDSSNVKEFLYQEGKLTSVSFGAAPTVQLMFSSVSTKHKAEKFRWQILRAFESALETAVTIEIRCQCQKSDAAVAVDAPRDSSSQNRGGGIEKTEIVQVEDSPKEVKGKKIVDASGTVMDSYMQLPPSFPKRVAAVSKNPSQSIVRGRVSLGHVIRHAEGCSQHGVWSRRKAVSIAEKLEQENLRLEPRSRNLLYWKVSRGTGHNKLPRFKIRPRRSHSLLKLVSCGQCLSGKSSSR